MKTLLLLPLILLSTSTHAQSACWNSEINPTTKKIFSTPEVWQKDNEAWDSQKPEEPSLWSLFWAKQTVDKESTTAAKLKSDKKKHCYMGCRITQDTSYSIAVYVAWLKEHKDLNDCDGSTFFEPLDERATLVGAQHASSTESPQDCYDFCNSLKPKNVKSWPLQD